MAEINIDITLDEGSIQAAINKINFLQACVKRASRKVGNYLLDEGVKNAKSELERLGVWDPGGPLGQSIERTAFSEGSGQITAGKYYAKYVEYGTGKHSMGTKKMARGENVSGINFGKGKRSSAGGWHYQDDEGQWYTTQGQPPKPFMQNTLNTLRWKTRTEVPRIAEEELPNL